MTNIATTINRGEAMKRKSTIGMLAMTSIATTLFISLIFSLPLWGENLIVEFVHVEGEVNFKDSGYEDWYRAEEGTKVTSGAVIYANVNSEAILSWGNGHVLKVSPLSLIRLSKIEFDVGKNIEKNKIDLNRGKLLAKAKKLTSKNSNFQVITPNVQAGIRGTEFAVEILDDSSTLVSVLEGDLDIVVVGLETLLEEGNRIQIRPGEEARAKPEHQRLEWMLSIWALRS